MSKYGELRTESRKVQFRNFLLEVLWPEMDIVFVGLKPLGSLSICTPSVRMNSGMMD